MTDCWLWARSVDGGGYGVFGRIIDGKCKMFKAHRVMWEEVNGLVPVGLELDHLCRNRLCINPDHLEAVTHQENVLRGLAPSALKAKQQVCHKGHAFRSRRTARGNRECLPCKAERARSYLKQKKELKWQLSQS